MLMTISTTYRSDIAIANPLGRIGAHNRSGKNSIREQEGEAKTNRRIFYDFTFSPPKSVSIATLVASDERIVESHDKAVRAALVEFEMFAATRVRKNR